MFPILSSDFLTWHKPGCAWVSCNTSNGQQQHALFSGFRIPYLKYRRNQHTIHIIALEEKRRSTKCDSNNARHDAHVLANRKVGPQNLAQSHMNIKQRQDNNNIISIILQTTAAAHRTTTAAAATESAPSPTEVSS